jgi:hypothetical protein
LTRDGPRPLPWPHEIPNLGISPPPAYSSAKSGKMRGFPGSSPPSDTLQNAPSRHSGRAAGGNGAHQGKKEHSVLAPALWCVIPWLQRSRSAPGMVPGLDERAEPAVQEEPQP